MSLVELDRDLYKSKVINPGETVYEVITAENKLGWGMAVADIIESEPHLHKETREVYVVMEGELEVVLGEETRRLKPEDCLVIEPGIVHKARAIGEQPARIVAFTRPAWRLEDHLLVEKT